MQSEGQYRAFPLQSTQNFFAFSLATFLCRKRATTFVPWGRETPASLWRISLQTTPRWQKTLHSLVCFHRTDISPQCSAWGHQEFSSGHTMMYVMQNYTCHVTIM